MFPDPRYGRDDWKRLQAAMNAGDWTEASHIFRRWLSLFEEQFAGEPQCLEMFRQVLRGMEQRAKGTDPQQPPPDP